MKTGSWTNNRGIALLIVLLVTALLIALIFEFSYATRISLNSAINFRDSQRAYFLARAGVKAFIKYKDDLIKTVPQDEWWAPPFIGEADTQVLIKWQDEAGKIRVSDVRLNTNRRQILTNLFGIKRVDLDILDMMSDPSADTWRLALLSGMHSFMNDESFNKVKDCITAANTVDRININTASAEVLQSLGISSDASKLIIEERSKQLYTADSMANSPLIQGVMVPGLHSNAAANFLTYQSDTYTVYSYAKVGGYIKQIEAIIQSGNATPLYWRAL
jgi:type II secretory pathway component PulK